MQEKDFAALLNGRVLLLAEKIRMPRFVVLQMQRLALSYNFIPLYPFYKGLNIPGEAEAAARQLREKTTGDSWCVELMVHLAAAVTAYELHYETKGIHHGIFMDTMRCFSRFVMEHKASYGTYGFDRGFWTWRQTSGLIFRVGVLEYEETTFNSTQKNSLLQQGDAILSVHIPSDIGLNTENLRQSYAEAGRFYDRYFSQYHYKAMFCSTWLLSPVLKGLLGEKSGILCFQQDYRLLWETPDSDDGVKWIFKDNKPPVKDFPETTSLQRKAKQLMLQGGHIGSAAGVVEHNGMLARAGCFPFV